MATITTTIRPARSCKDGRCKIEIAISHKSRTCYLFSGIYIEKLSTAKLSTGCQYPFSEGCVTKKDPRYLEKNAQLNKIVQEYTVKINDISDITQYSCAELVKKISAERRPSRITLTYAAAEYADVKMKIGQKGVKNARMCTIAVERFVAWLGIDMYVSEVNSILLKSYIEHLKNKTVEKLDKVPYRLPCGQKRYKRKMIKTKALSIGTISSDISRLRAVLRYQEECQVNWHEVHIPQASRCDCDIEVEQLRHYMSVKMSDKVEQIARDVWMLSFYLGGINYTDMMAATYLNDELTYVREKTKNRTDEEQRCTIPICVQARAIINKYMREDGSLDFGYNYANKDDELRQYAQEYRDARFDYNMPPHFMFKSARHTFAQFATDLNLPERVTNYILAHAEGKSNIMYYYRRIKPRQVQQVMNIVFDYVEHPEKYNEVLQYTQLLRDVI